MLQQLNDAVRVEDMPTSQSCAGLSTKLTCIADGAKFFCIVFLLEAFARLVFFLILQIFLGNFLFHFLIDLNFFLLLRFDDFSNHLGLHQIARLLSDVSSRHRSHYRRADSSHIILHTLSCL